MIETLRRAASRSVMLAVVLGTASCAVIQPPLPEDAGTLQRESLRFAQAHLAGLGETDVQLWLDNDLLEQAILDGLALIQGDAGVPGFTHLSVEFGHQLILLRATLPSTAGPGADGGETLAGWVELGVTDDGLTWSPHFVAAAASELERSIAARLEETGANRFPFELLPLGILETGARLSAGVDVVASVSEALGGHAVTSGMATLIGPDTTRLAIDLAFLPGVTGCEPDLGVSRSGFAATVREREPEPVSEDSPMSVFFSEISGAALTTGVRHYWFADGLAAGVQELPVEPSDRWRTWSSRPPDVNANRDWSVYVVESESGCLLTSARLEVGVTGAGSSSGVSSEPTYEAYEAAFLEHVEGFPVHERMSAPAVADIGRPFLAVVLDEALRDVRLATRLDVGSAEPRRLNAELLALDTSRLRCEEPDCDVARECAVDFGNCPLERDTRDCVSCELRNPLNNRCLREAEDATCVAARSRRNARLEAEREACIDSQRRSRTACEAVRDRMAEHCEADAAGRLRACQAEIAGLRALEHSASPVAAIEMAVETAGGVDMQFRRFRLEHDLSRLYMTVGLSADLELTGQIQFTPWSALQAAAPCTERWNGEFESFAVLPQWGSGLSGSLRLDHQSLASDWSGLTHEVALNPSPLGALFRNRPGLLAGCGTRLGIGDVGAAVSGPDADVLKGRLALSIQPLPTRLLLLPAWMTIGGGTLTGEPGLGETHVTYTFQDSDDP